MAITSINAHTGFSFSVEDDKVVIDEHDWIVQVSMQSIEDVAGMEKAINAEINRQAKNDFLDMNSDNCDEYHIYEGKEFIPSTHFVVHKMEWESYGTQDKVACVTMRSV